MIVCGLTIDDSAPFAQELRQCSECIIERAAKVLDEMSGEWVRAGNEVCSAHGQELAQMGVLLKKISKTDTAILDVLDSWEYRSN
jgi:hypothetical protein